MSMTIESINTYIQHMFSTTTTDDDLPEAVTAAYKTLAPQLGRLTAEAVIVSRLKEIMLPACTSHGVERELRMTAMRKRVANIIEGSRQE